MTSITSQMHLVGLLVPQLGQIFAKQATSSSQLRQGVRQVGRFDLAIITSSSAPPPESSFQPFCEIGPKS
jgi:hypothetical protein